MLMYYTLHKGRIMTKNFNEGREKTEIFSLRIPKQMRVDMQKVADQEGVAPAFIVRHAIQNFLDEQTKTTKNE